MEVPVIRHLSHRASWGYALRFTAPGTNNCLGFTLVELLVVITILGILATLMIPSFYAFVGKVKISRCMAEIRNLEREIAAYNVDKNLYPNTLNDINEGNLLDPWGRPYRYLNIANGGAPRQSGFGIDLNTDFDIYSVGPDGLSQQDITAQPSQDDIVRAGDGGWIGLGKDF